MFFRAFCLSPAIPSLGLQLVTSDLGFGSSPPMLGGACAVCARVWVLASSHLSWLGCCVCVFGYRYWLQPASSGWGVWLCVFVRVLCLFLTLVCGVRVGSGYALTPPTLAGVSGYVGLFARPASIPPILAGVCAVCFWVRVWLSPRQSSLGCWGVRTSVPGSPSPHLTHLAHFLKNQQGRVQAERAHRHTHTPTPKPRVARRSQNPSQSTNIRTMHPAQVWRGSSGACTQTHPPPKTKAKSGGVQPTPEPEHTHRQCTPKPGVPGYQQSAHTNTRTPQHPSQEWQGAAETRAQPHTHPPHTPARSGGVQAEVAHKCTNTPTPQQWVAVRSQTPSRSTHTRTAHRGQRSRGTHGVCTQTHTHPNTPTRNGGAQPKTKAKHEQPHRAPEPGWAG